MSVTRDCFGRVKTTHQCPSCGARFLSAAKCRGVGEGPGSRAHANEVQTLPIYGCDEPPDRPWAVALPTLILAPTEAKARELARSTVERAFPRRVAERYGDLFHPIALETREESLHRSTTQRRAA